jgi:integrase
MASFRKLKTGIRAEVFVKGHRDSRMFDTMPQAKKWALERENELAELAQGIDTKRTVGDVLERYAREISPTKRTGRNERIRLERMAKDPVACVKLTDLKPGDFAQWRDERLKSVGNASVLREMNILHHAFEIARKEWGWIQKNPVSDVTRPKSPPPRDRLISDQEQAAILLALGFFEDAPPKTKGQYVAIAFLFAIETAMRAGEICGLRPGDIKGRVAHLPMTKNGTARKVPLSTRAIELLALLPDPGDKPLFRLNTEQLSSLFRKARIKAGIDDLVFHDTRHQAITNLAKRLSVLDLARMVGHRDIRMLQIYYNITAEELAGRLE